MRSSAVYGDGSNAAPYRHEDSVCCEHQQRQTSTVVAWSDQSHNKLHKRSFAPERDLPNIPKTRELTIGTSRAKHHAHQRNRDGEYQVFFVYRQRKRSKIQPHKIAPWIQCRNPRVPSSDSQKVPPSDPQVPLFYVSPLMFAQRCWTFGLANLGTVVLFSSVAKFIVWCGKIGCSWHVGCWCTMVVRTFVFERVSHCLTLT